MTHELKAWPAPFHAMRDGRKTFEWRRDDRTPSFAAGDRLVIREWDPHKKAYTDGVLTADVPYVLKDAFLMPPGFAILSLRNVVNHTGCGATHTDGSPIYGDCSCRGTADQPACADTGCGFCRAKTTRTP